MALLDLLGRRWTLRIIWELREAPLTFRALRAQCEDVSPSVLNQRLTELREAMILETGESGYTLTRDGLALVDLLLPVHLWADRWAKRFAHARQKSLQRPFTSQSP